MTRKVFREPVSRPSMLFRPRRAEKVVVRGSDSYPGRRGLAILLPQTLRRRISAIRTKFFSRSVELYWLSLLLRGRLSVKMPLKAPLE
jgi:hypothetical protein